MEVKAKLRYLHMAPRKVRLVIDEIRGMDTREALGKLEFIEKAAAKPVSKLVNSAIANAEHNFDLDKSNLYIKEIRADEGPKFKRWRPRAFGRAFPIVKRTSHILITLDEKVAGKKAKKGPETSETKGRSLVDNLKKIGGKKGKVPKGPEKVEAANGEAPPPKDQTREGGRRHKQHEDKKRMEKQQDASRLKRFFRRKSV